MACPGWVGNWRGKATKNTGCINKPVVLWLEDQGLFSSGPIHHSVCHISHWPQPKSGDGRDTSVYHNYLSAMKASSSCCNISTHPSHQVPTSLLEDCWISPFLTYLFNKSLEAGEVLTKWKQQWAKPIFKCGTTEWSCKLKTSYLMCVMLNLMEHVVCFLIHTQTDRMSILSPFQHSFHSDFSCETQLLLTFNGLATIHNKGLQMDIGILDFSKAFKGKGNLGSKVTANAL